MKDRGYYKKFEGAYLPEILVATFDELVEIFQTAKNDPGFWEEYVEIDPIYFWAREVELLLADASKARKELDWNPRNTFTGLVKIMVDSDMELAGLDSPGEGKKILKKKGISWTENHLTVG